MPETITANKITYGLKNVYYSVITESITEGELSVTYATPVAIPGAVNMSVKANTEKTAVAADDDPEYAVIYDNKGYDGELEAEVLPDSFYTDVLKSTADTNSVIFENKDDKPVNIALLFEFSGDKHKVRHVLYNCSVTKPDIESSTTGDKTEPKTVKLSFSASPAKDTGDIKAKCPQGNTKYESWFTQVYKKATV